MALVVEDLVKVYPNGKKAVNHISFSVRKGSLFAFLGENGAGKSTTINIICSILSKDQGKILVEGYDLDKQRLAIKQILGVVFQSSVLDNNLMVYDNLALRASFYSLPDDVVRKQVDDIVKLLDLGPILKQKVGTLSGGQKRRVDIARAIVHSPKFLILDEPTTGLDPKARKMVWGLIDKIRRETGMTVFLTTHYLEESELATYVVIMDHGEIVARGTPNELKNAYSNDTLLVYHKADPELNDRMNRGGLNFTFDPEKKVYRIVAKDTQEASRLLLDYSDVFQDVEIRKGTMDDVFLRVIGREKQPDEEK